MPEGKGGRPSGPTVSSEPAARASAPGEEKTRRLCLGRFAVLLNHARRARRDTGVPPVRQHGQDGHATATWMGTYSAFVTVTSITKRLFVAMSSAEPTKAGFPKVATVKLSTWKLPKTGLSVSDPVPLP